MLGRLSMLLTLLALVVSATDASAASCRHARSTFVAETGIADQTQEFVFLVPIDGATLTARSKFGGNCLRIVFSAEVLTLDVFDVGGSARTYVQAFVNGSVENAQPDPTSGSDPVGQALVAYFMLTPKHVPLPRLSYLSIWERRFPDDILHPCCSSKIHLI